MAVAQSSNSWPVLSGARSTATPFWIKAVPRKLWRLLRLVSTSKPTRLHIGAGHESEAASHQGPYNAGLLNTPSFVGTQSPCGAAAIVAGIGATIGAGVDF